MAKKLQVAEKKVVELQSEIATLNDVAKKLQIAEIRAVEPEAKIA